MGLAPMSELASPGKTWPVFLLICAYLILQCLWRLFTPGGSWPMPPWHYVSMASDVLLWAVMIGLKSQLTPLIAYDRSRARLANTLFWSAFLAGIIMILLRLTSDSAWWTGHRIPTL